MYRLWITGTDLRTKISGLGRAAACEGAIIRVPHVTADRVLSEVKDALLISWTHVSRMVRSFTLDELAKNSEKNPRCARTNPCARCPRGYT